MRNKILVTALSILSVFWQSSLRAAAQEEIPASASAISKLEKFNRKTSGSWRVSMNRKSGLPRSLVAGSGLRAGKNESAARSFLKSNEDFLGVDAARLKLKLQRKSPVGEHFYFEQYYKSLKVENAYVKVNADKSGDLINYQSTYVKDLDLDTNPSQTASQASSAAVADAGGGLARRADLAIFSQHGDKASAALAWKVRVESADGKWDYFINAQSGEILNKISLLQNANYTFEANLNPVYPGFSGSSAKGVPLSHLVFNASGNVVSSSMTNATGTATLTLSTTTSRLFHSFKGKHFRIADQGFASYSSPRSYYISTTTQDNAAGEWKEVPFDGTVVFQACDGPNDYPFFGAPQFEGGFAVGDMSPGGVIGDRTFLKVIDKEDNSVLGEYIGTLSDAFSGPVVSVISTATASPTSVKFAVSSFSGKTGSYSVSKTKVFCARELSSAATATTHIAHEDSKISASAYYNLNNMREFFASAKLNNGGKTYVDLDTPITVMVNASGVSTSAYEDGMPNAFYDPDEKIIMFGRGKRDDISPNAFDGYRNFALEAAIVRHEYVHAVMDRIWPIRYFDEGAAIAEATADYFALSSITTNSDSGNWSGTPLTGRIGDYVNPSGEDGCISSLQGEGSVRNLAGSCVFSPADWAANGINGHHKNSLVLSQALWGIRTGTNGSVADGATTKADAIVWAALMFFPESLIEFRDAVYTSAKALYKTESSLHSEVLSSFAAHGITDANVIDPNGDIYEPNDSPNSASGIDIYGGSKSITARIDPQTDADYYSLALNGGQLSVTVNLPPAGQSVYYVLSLVLLDALNRTLVAMVSPHYSAGETNGLTNDKTAVLSYNVPSPANGGTGRYILGVLSVCPDGLGGAASCHAGFTGQYSLDFKFAKTSAIGAVTITNYPADFNDGTQIDFKVPYISTGTLASTFTGLSTVLQDWSTGGLEAFYAVRLLDSGLNPIGGLNEYSTVTVPASSTIVGGEIEGSAVFKGNFASLGYSAVHLQVLGKLRSHPSDIDDSGTPEDKQRGIVSLGISGLIKNPKWLVNKVEIRNAIFNPLKSERSRLPRIVWAPGYGNISVRIFALDGLPVKKLYEGPSEGIYDGWDGTWDGRNENGTVVASGVYLLRVDGAGIDRLLKKIVVVK
jgi:Zn-dependent metalloprotease